jgi:hypothetical protein
VSDTDKMRTEFEAAANAYNYLTVRCTNGDYTDSETRSAWNFYQIGYAVGRKAEREEVDCKTEKLLAEFRIFIEEVERTGIYYDNAIVGTALANAWRVFDDIAARIRGKPEGGR